MFNNCSDLFTLVLLMSLCNSNNCCNPCDCDPCCNNGGNDMLTMILLLSVLGNNNCCNTKCC